MTSFTFLLLYFLVLFAISIHTIETNHLPAANIKVMPLMENDSEFSRCNSNTFGVPALLLNMNPGIIQTSSIGNEWKCFCRVLNLRGFTMNFGSKVLKMISAP